MKKGIIITGIVVALLVGAILALALLDFNRMGKENVYYQIESPSEVEETKLDSGEIIERFIYKGEAYNENGETISIEFSAAKQLREGAYLKLYLNKQNEVTSYDEVEQSEVPDTVKF